MATQRDGFQNFQNVVCSRRFWWPGWVFWLWICGFLCCLTSFRKTTRLWVKQEKQSKAMMVISPIPGCFLVYRLNNEVKQTTRLFQSTDGDFSSTRVFPGVPFDKWVKQGKPIKSNDGVFPGEPFDKQGKSIKNPSSPSTYQDVNMFENKRTGMVWADFVITRHLQLGHLEKQFHRKTIMDLC